jgi:quercetin 2,3-dioxygenase
MTAASGLVHEEKHGAEFAKRGGRFEMIQLWVNLPAKDKMSKPRYQGIQTADISEIELVGGAGNVRVIAGEFASGINQANGPAKTFSPINLWDVRLNANHSAEFRMPKGFTTAVFVLSGKIRLTTGEVLTEAELGVFDREEELFSLNAVDDAKILILGGEPLNEPIVGYGPFVMNSKREIEQAFRDFESGEMGKIGQIEGSQS